MSSAALLPEYGPIFNLAHDYGTHHHGCTIDEGSCSCGFSEACDLAIRAESLLREIATHQREALKIVEVNGFVFESIGKEPGNWQHLAFTLYSNICEIDMLARSALGVEVGA